MRGKILLLSMIVSIMTAMGVTVVHALPQNFRSGRDVVVQPGETIDKTLFISGRNVDIAGTINGDVFCAGQTVSVSGTINGDLFCAGQDVHVSGTVSGSVRTAAQSLSIAGPVSRSVSVAAQSITLEPTGKIGQDTSVAGEDVVLDGSITRDVMGVVTDLTVNGAVGRDIQATVMNLHLGSTATVGGSIAYTSAQQLTRDRGASVTGAVTRTEPTHETRRPILWHGLLFALYISAALLLVALVLVLLFPYPFERVTDVTVHHPLMILLVGLAANVLVPAFILVLFVSLIGIPLAALVLLAWLLTLLLAGPVAAYFVGRLLLAGRTGNAVLYMLLGAAILLALCFVPILGLLVVLVSVWLGVGTLLLQFPRLPRPRYEVAPSAPKAP